MSSNDCSQPGDANCVAFESDAHSRVRHPNLTQLSDLPKPTKSRKLNGISLPDCSQLGDGQLRIVRKLCPQSNRWLLSVALHVLDTENWRTELCGRVCSVESFF